MSPTASEKHHYYYWLLLETENTFVILVVFNTQIWKQLYPHMLKSTLKRTDWSVIDYLFCLKVPTIQSENIYQLFQDKQTKDLIQLNTQNSNIQNFM